MTLEEWVAWIRETESVNQSNESSDQWAVNQRFAQDRLIAASSRINDALAAGGWSTPLAAPYPPSVVQATGWIAWWNSEIWGSIRETVQAHYDDTIKWLDALDRGAAILTGPDGLQIPKIAIVSTTSVGSMYSGSRIAVNPWQKPAAPEIMPRRIWSE